MTGWVREEVKAELQLLRSKNSVLLALLQRIEYGMRHGGGPDRAEIQETIRKAKATT